MNESRCIIEDNRIDILPYVSRLDDESNAISWKALGYLVKSVKDGLIIGDKYEKYSILPNNKEYSIRFPKGDLYTNEKANQFVSIMLGCSNFALADKIKFVVFRQVGNEYKACGIVTEEF